MPCEHWWDVQAAVAASPPPDALFPNLRHLTIIPKSPYDDRGVHPGFLDLVTNRAAPPTITTSTISALHLLSVRASHIPDPRGLLARNPALTNIRIDHAPDDMADADADDAGFAAAVLHAMRQYRHLTCLELSLCGDFNSAQISALSHLHGLRSLSLSNSHRPPETRPPRPLMRLPSDSNGFRNLQTLKLFYFQYQDVLAIIRCARDLPLESISLYVPVPSSAAFKALMDAICMHCRPSTLRECRIRWLSNVEVNGPMPWGFSRAHVEQLSAFSNLTDVVLEHLPGVELLDEDVTLLAGCWPALRSLVLTKWAGWAEQASLTLGALVSIARYCPEIERVDLHLDARAVPQAELEVPQEPGVPQDSESAVPQMEPMERLDTRPSLLRVGAHPPLRLTVRNAPIEDADAVAQLLKRLFPGIQEVKFYGIHNTLARAWGKKWKRVNSSLLAEPARDQIDRWRRLCEPMSDGHEENGT